MIHVVFALYDKTGRYSKFTGTTMLSLFENHVTPPRVPSITVHLLHDNTLSADSREKFSYIAGQYNQRVKFYNVEELCADKVAEIKSLLPNAAGSRFSIATCYRFMIPQIFPSDIDKCIYLDSDVIVNLDISELWRIELGDKVLGVVPTLSQNVPRDWMRSNFRMCGDGVVSIEDYFNAGILLINVKAFREAEAELLRGIKFVSDHPRYEFPDQDVLNYCFAAQALKLPTKFNRYMHVARRNREPIGRNIYHYVGYGSKLSFGMSTKDPFNRLWLDYFIRTPFFDADTIGRLYEIFETSYNNVLNTVKNSVVNVSAVMSGKTREFLSAPENIGAIRNVFSVHDDERIIPFDSPDAVQKLLDRMHSSRGRKVFFILVPNFPFKVLLEAGFRQGVDFVNGLDFLSEAHGFPLNSYAMVKSL